MFVFIARLATFSRQTPTLQTKDLQSRLWMHCPIVINEENAHNKYIELITKYNNSPSWLQYSGLFPVVWFGDTNVLAAFTFRV